MNMFAKLRARQVDDAFAGGYDGGKSKLERQALRRTVWKDRAPWISAIAAIIAAVASVAKLFMN